MPSVVPIVMLDITAIRVKAISLHDFVSIVNKLVWLGATKLFDFVIDASLEYYKTSFSIAEA
ncbi:MAG: hypothetical protein Salg2KO_09060 [Salibacteraceae bacterium]